MKKLVIGLAASCCGFAISAGAMAEPFSDGTFRAGFLMNFQVVTCPSAMTVIGTKIMTDPGYPWTVAPQNFGNLVRATTEIPFVGATMDNNVAKCFYKLNGSFNAPGVMLMDNQHFLQLRSDPVCGSTAKYCIFSVMRHE